MQRTLPFIQAVRAATKQYTALHKARNSSVVTLRHLSGTPFDGTSGSSTKDNTGTGIEIPVYSRSNETVEMKRARLVYQSRKRGTLENGLLLSTFASAHLKSFSPQQLDEYDRLINRPSNDWDIYHWMTGMKEVPSEYESSVMSLLKDHVQNKNRESRIVQPQLD